MLYRLNGHSRPSRSRQARARRPYRNRQYDNAVARAFVGAKLLMGRPVVPNTQVEAAQLVGSTALYVAAAATVIDAENPSLIDHVLHGNIPLLEAAESV